MAARHVPEFAAEAAERRRMTADQERQLQKQHAKRMFAWQQHVARDRQLKSAYCLHVVVILTSYMSWRTGKARVETGHIARALGITPRAVQICVAQLIERRHLQKIAGEGRFRANQYIPVLSDADADGNSELPFAPSANNGSQMANHGSPDMRTVVRPSIHYKESIEDIGEHPHASFFKEWYGLYPKKVAEGSARREYCRIIDAGLATADELKAGVVRYAANVASEPYEFIKQPDRWLRDERWKDEAAPQTSNQPGVLLRRTVGGWDRGL
jgi:hypothetical protein